MGRKFYDGEWADRQLAARVADQDPPRRRVERYDDEDYAPFRPAPRGIVWADVGAYVLMWGASAIATYVYLYPTWGLWVVFAALVGTVFGLAFGGQARWLSGLIPFALAVGLVLLVQFAGVHAPDAPPAPTPTIPAPTSPAGAGATGDTQQQPTPLPATPEPAPVAPVVPPAAPAEQPAPTAVPPTPAPMAPPATEVWAAPTEAPTAAPMAPPPTAAPPTAVPPPTATPEPELACINGHVHRLYWNGLDLADEGTSCGTW